MGDFTGFTFGNKHSSDLGIIRVSSGNRYEDKLHPDIEDKTTEIPGLNGSYYFGGNYKAKTIEINIVFDSLNEEQIRLLKKTFNLTDIKNLIFDEYPYKKYIAKVESPIELSYVCFDERVKFVDVQRNGVRRNRSEDSLEDRIFTKDITVPAMDSVVYGLPYPSKGEVTISGMESYIEEDGFYTFTNETEEEIDVSITYTYEVLIPAWEQVTPYSYSDRTERIYKGEGKIRFICYFPFAKSVFKQIPFVYVKTSDTEVVTNKKYFTYNNSSNIYELVDNPSIDDIDTYYERINESNDWADSSGILSVNDYEMIDKYNDETGEIKIYNGGDLSTGFRLYIPGDLSQQMSISYKKNNLETEDTASLIINSFELEDGDIGVLIDTTNSLIVGVESYTAPSGIDGNTIYTTSGNIYNKFVDSGYFFSLEPNNKYDNATLQIENGPSGIEIFYDYLYY